MVEINKLTAKFCDHAKPVDKDGQPVKSRLFGDGAGLYLQVTASSDPERPSKSWVFRYSGKRLGLGSYATVKLAEARERAAYQRKLIADEKDPLQVKRDKQVAAIAEAAKVVPTYDECFAKFVAHRAGDWTNATHARQWAKTHEQYVRPIIGKLPVDTIDRDHVLAVLEQSIGEGKSFWLDMPVTADRVRGRIFMVLGFAIARGWLKTNNPADWRTLKNALCDPRKREVEHQPALPLKDVPAFIAQVSATDSAAARALELNILTATRSSEAREARWEEFNLETKTWTNPAERMKGKIGKRKAHHVPRSSAVIALLDRIEPDQTKRTGLLFAARTGQLSTGGCRAICASRSRLALYRMVFARRLSTGAANPLASPSRARWRNPAWRSMLPKRASRTSSATRCTAPTIAATVSTCASL
jgi:integrase